MNYERHADISVFGETESQTFPLIMVVGREPNADQIVGHFIGQYDFTKYKNVGFWNESYRFIANAARAELKQLKQKCVENRSSPIIYADALPIGILAREKNKNIFRKNIPNNQTKKHHQMIFAHKDIISRVELVILSGLQYSVFDFARTSFLEECRISKKSFVELPFFYFCNAKKLRNRLSDNAEQIQSILERFKN